VSPAKLEQHLPTHSSNERRHWDQNRKIDIVNIGAGELYASQQHELISTLLGSCVAVCLYDPINKIGGMNHFKLPHPGKEQLSTIPRANYGSYAIDALIEKIMGLGGKLSHLRAEVYGGGSVIDGLNSNIGEKNIEFALAYLQQKNIPVTQCVVAGTRAQQIFMHPSSGHVFSVWQGQRSLSETKTAEKIYLEGLLQQN